MKPKPSRRLRCAVIMLLAACACSRDPRTPEEAAALGAERLKQMRTSLEAAPAFSFHVAEIQERVRRSGEKTPLTLERDVAVRRPDRLRAHTTGSDERDLTLTYDGRELTIVGDRQKVYATIAARPTLDETLDLITERFDIPLPVADFLYSSLGESFDMGTATGGWKRRVDIGGRPCDEMAYSLPEVDFTLAVAADAQALPCHLEVTYKTRPSQPVTRLTFSNWNLGAKPDDAQFVAQVPAGYEKIPVIERIPKDELKADPAKAMGVAPKK